MLSGIDEKEFALINTASLDIDAGLVIIDGNAGRSVPLAPRLRTLAKNFADDPASLSQAELAAEGALQKLISHACHAAGLADPAKVTPGALRHSYCCYLMRQGALFDQVDSLMGGLEPTLAEHYRNLAPPMPGRPLDQITVIHPALS